jgi:hypothetical protein
MPAYAKAKNWTQPEMDLFLDFYTTRRRSGMKILAAKIEAQNAAVSEDRRYSESTLGIKKAMPAYITEQLAIIEANHVAEGSPRWTPPGGSTILPGLTHPEPGLESAVREANAPNEIQMTFMRTTETVARELVMCMTMDITSKLQQYIDTRMDLGFNQILDYMTDPEKKGEVGVIDMDEIRRRRKIVIVGLLDRQFEIIKKEFPKLRLVNIESNQTGSRLAPACETAELVIIMTDWVNHSIESVVRKYAPVWMRCTGTIAALRAKLKDIN